MASIRAPSHANAQEDCHALHRAFRGLGTDEEEVIRILAHRSTSQRLEIVRSYKAMFGEELEDRIKSELSGKFERAVVLWLLDPAVRDAQLLHDAFKGLGTKDHTLIDIVCTRTSAQIALIKQAYQARYNRELAQDIASETSGHYKELLLAYIANRRPDGPGVDREVAYVEARELYRAGEGHMGTNEESYIRILSTRGPAELAAILSAYREKYGHSFGEAVKKETSGLFQAALIAIVQANYPANYFVQAFKNATEGSGTDSERLTQLVVTRAEVDMLYIKVEFQNKCNKSLEQVVSAELSGDHQKFLLALIGN